MRILPVCVLISLITTVLSATELGRSREPPNTARGHGSASDRGRAKATQGSGGSPVIIHGTPSRSRNGYRVGRGRLRSSKRGSHGEAISPPTEQPEHRSKSRAKGRGGRCDGQQGVHLHTLGWPGKRIAKVAESGKAASSKQQDEGARPGCKRQARALCENVGQVGADAYRCSALDLPERQ
jgi:hypothetical protein